MVSSNLLAPCAMLPLLFCASCMTMNPGSMSKYAEPTSQPSNFCGSYKDRGGGTTIGRSLWKILVLDKDRSIGAADDAETRIEMAEDGSLIAVLLIGGDEIARKPVALRYKRGYLLSDEQQAAVSRMGG